MFFQIIFNASKILIKWIVWWAEEFVYDTDCSFIKTRNKYTSVLYIYIEHKVFFYLNLNLKAHANCSVCIYVAWHWLKCCGFIVTKSSRMTSKWTVYYSVMNVLVEAHGGMLQRWRKGSMQTRRERWTRGRMNAWTPKIFCIWWNFLLEICNRYSF